MQIMGDGMERKCGSPEVYEIRTTFRSETRKGRDRSNVVGVVWVTIIQLVLRKSWCGFMWGGITEQWWVLLVQLRSSEPRIRWGSSGIVVLLFVH